MPDKDHHNLDQDPEQVSEELVEDSAGQFERRKMIKAAIASVPIVLTITAGRARAQDTGSIISSDSSDPAGDELDEDSLSEEEDAALDALSSEPAAEFSSEELQILNEGVEGTE